MSRHYQAMSMLLNKTIRLFLDSIGRREEYEYYLDRFTSGGSRAFALLVPERDGFEEAAGVFVFDMQFLLKLGLDPVILLCGTDATALRDLLELEDHPFDWLPVQFNDPLQSWDAVLTGLETARRNGHALVLMDASCDLEAALRVLLPALSRRVHFIRLRGPLHDADGKPLGIYQIQSTMDSSLASEDQALAGFAGTLLETVPGLHISVASPLQLLKELFTVKGAGCLIRRMASIRHVRGLDELDARRLTDLLEAAFGKRLQQRGFLDSAIDFYVEEQYLGAAILEPCGSVMYLSKFAVQAEARGEGLAQELWRAVCADHQSLFWRSSLRNPVNQWYDRQADGYHCQGRWKVYWRGVPADLIPTLIHNAIARPEDFASDTNPAVT